ncbi:E3 ubiquitin-protein ligase MARCHF2-like [Ornithodoros turicata]|uniref:E3 ubiquitin-protein ligase MARCHF2-like n=1 Tax=Ornithodoros turicata TaxID=34597 RepID=UPI003139DD20
MITRHTATVLNLHPGHFTTYLETWTNGTCLWVSRVMVSTLQCRTTKTNKRSRNEEEAGEDEEEDVLALCRGGMFLAASGSPADAMTSEGAAVCRICFLGTSAGLLLQPCLCRGTIGYTHRYCMQRWVSERREDQCNICLYVYSIRKEPKSLVAAFFDKDGRKEPLIYLFLGLLFSSSLAHVFGFSIILTMNLWRQLAWYIKVLNTVTLSTEFLVWATIPTVAFKMAWESCQRWRQLNADWHIILPGDGGTNAQPAMPTSADGAVA